MMMSIVHRMTGTANYWGFLLIAIWLTAAAMGEEAFQLVNWLLGTPIGLLILLGLSWSLINHALGGIRHFIWDTGWGLSICSIQVLSWLTLLGSATLTAVLWLVILLKLGVL
jgi:succinate dehydrogenase / fumarate reductase cytochrome b subunit